MATTKKLHQNTALKIYYSDLTVLYEPCLLQIHVQVYLIIMLSLGSIEKDSVISETLL